jgi:hypothetical protein
MKGKLIQELLFIFFKGYIYLEDLVPRAGIIYSHTRARKFEYKMSAFFLQINKFIQKKKQQVQCII